MISINDKKDCCGCLACVQSCPKRCIRLLEDGEGFLYPSVDKDTCVGCGKCEKVCPMLCGTSKRTPEATYAATNLDEYVRSHSSSGGIFSLLSEYVIRHGGVVFGAAFNDNMEVVHSYTESVEGLAKFRGSKYVQSRTEDSLLDAERFLKEGRDVLYSGTPCQVAGLKSYLGKTYGNLLAVDFVCHGVPSPGIFREYLGEESRKGKIVDVNFRDKVTGWKNYSMTLLYDDTAKDPGCIQSEIFHKNLYMKGFLGNLYLRPSCHSCRFKEGGSGSDITLGDFWGIDKIRPELDDDKGISLVIANNERADGLLKTLGCKLEEMPIGEAIKYNPSVSSSVNVPTYRNLFFAAKKHSGLKQALKLCCSDSIRYRIVRKISKMML